MTRRAHFEQLERATGQRPEALDGPAFPVGLEYLWGWFGALHERRGGGGFGPAPVSYPDLLAWATLTGEQPTPWELELLGQVDTAYLLAVAEDQKQRANTKR